MANNQGGPSHPHAIDSYLNDNSDPRTIIRQAREAFIPGARLAHSIVRYGGTGTSTLQHGASSAHDTYSHGSLAALTLNSLSTDTGSVSTSIGARDTNPRVLEPNEYNILEVPQPTGFVTYECPFDHINCRLIFTNFDTWYTHSLTHFREVQPPVKNQCPFCDSTFYHTNGMRSWRQRMEHVGNVHHAYGHQLRTARLDVALYRYLWKHQIIDELDFKELTGGRMPSAAEEVYPSPPTSPAGSTATGAYMENNRRRFNRTRR